MGRVLGRLVREDRDDNNERTAPVPRPGMPQLDQKNLLSSAGYGIVDSTQAMSQVFNVSHSGRLVSIEVSATKGDSHWDSPLHVMDMEVGVWNGPVLGTQTLQASALPPAGTVPLLPLDPSVTGPASYDFSSQDIELQPGQPYYFRLTHTDYRMFRVGTSYNLYGGGTAWGNGQWPAEDVAFKVVIVP